VKTGLSSRRAGALAALLLAAVALTGCAIVRPPGDAPLRYRDAVFTDVTKTSNLQYGSATNVNGETENLLLDLYQPIGDTATARPAIIWVHGGGFCCGDKGSGPSPDLANKFAKLGYVTASINYRLSAPNGCTGTGFGGECAAAVFDAQHDAQAAVRWFRANADTYGIDPNRIAIGGESAGGITATLVGLRSNDAGSSGNPGFSQRVQAFASISGGIIGGYFVDAPDTPAGIFFHGTADGTVPYSWSADTVEAMRALGKYPFLERYDGAGHVPYLQFGEQMFTHTSYYFYWTLDLAHADGQTAAAARAAERLTAKMPELAGAAR
jgi:acetyl esterase/lipase